MLTFIEDTAIEQKTMQKTYKYEEAYESSLAYFKGDELAARVWVTKYALKDSMGLIYEKNPDEMHRRLAREIFRIEKKYTNPLSEEEIYHVLKDFIYIIPQGGPMTGIGNKYQIASLSNCFVIGNEKLSDSYGGVMKIDQEQVQLMKRRGGVGHDLSHIRPKGSPVLNSALSSTGIVPFMERYSNSTREVAQDGRRGALMLSVSIRHPDAESFIDAKMEPGKITGANVSVKIDDEFMRAVIEDKPYTQRYPVDSANPKYSKVINARSLWNKIVHNAWKSAEPGILFWDTILRESVPDCYADLGYRTLSTNPCGEIPLCAYDSCRLIAINLYSYVDNPFTASSRFDFDLFKKHIQYSQRMMDDIIDLELEKIDFILDKINSDPEDPEIKRVEKNLWENIKIKAIEGRRTGIGITAEGDMLAALGLQYGSDNAIDFSIEVQKTLAIEAYRSSVLLAHERGPFPIFDFQREKNNPFIQRLRKADENLFQSMMEYGRRNIALLTIAPTGTTSLMTQTTSGIEPVFMPVYKRRRKVNPNDTNVRVTFTDEVGDSWEEYNVFHHKFITWLEVNGYDPKKVQAMNDYEIDQIVRKSSYNKASSNDVNWVSKVKMQGEIQKWVDHSISVSVNVPADATEDLIGKIYQTAWESGCKGITVYRDGSRTGVLVSNKKEQKEQQINMDQQIKRPKTLDAEIVRFQNNREKWIAFIGLKDGHPYEIFTGVDDEEIFPVPKSITKGKIIKIKDEQGNSRYDFQYCDKYGYAKNFSGMFSSLSLDSENINTWKNGVERALRKYIPDGTKAKPGEKCSACGSQNLVYQEGCLICLDCGCSKCS
ncbi:MAG: adenosylcobalamin-dependent ribonucleoside-diphosphate reductase [Bacteroidia bacterium]|nr:adenosylcobalamin-dependent ribonucleoside-diphosphate reductase [Bacteroidia bacterium]